jgi:hypothetical protein
MNAPSKKTKTTTKPDPPMTLPLPESVYHNCESLVFGIDVTFKQLRDYYQANWRDFYRFETFDDGAQHALAVEILSCRIGYPDLTISFGLPSLESDTYGTSSSDEPDRAVFFWLE